MVTSFNVRRLVLAVLTPAAALGASAGPSAAEPPSIGKPNVVVIMTDDQGYGDLGCHGNTQIRTPQMDKLHAESVRLTDFHVCPCCSLTRACLMTGRYAGRSGVWHTIMGRSLLRRGEVTMAEVFAAGGYRTGIFGKWHLGDNYPFRPQDRGFHQVLIHGGGAVGNTPDYWGNDYFGDTYFRNGRPEKFDGYCTDVWFDEAIKFIEANRDRPFFCYIPTNAPHGPHLVAPRYSRPYRQMGIKPTWADFYGMITCIDENLGRLRKKLQQLGIEDNTILIFTTDNGSSAGGSSGLHNSGMRGGKISPYDGGHRVPCFIHWPGGKLTAGRDVGHVTAAIDLLPTLIELCGLDKPQGVEFDGASLVPLLRKEARHWPERMLFTDNQRVDHPVKWRRSAVMTDRWRLVDGKELFDIQKDPGQRNDVAAEYPEVVRRLRAGYEAWWADISRSYSEDCRIILGAEQENPAVLTSHDYHGEVVWDQRQVRAGRPCDGFLAVEIARDGTYEFAVRRWPAEANLPITSGRGIAPTLVRLKIADFDQTEPIVPGATAVKFRVPLEAGNTRLQAWLIRGAEDGAMCGAYYIYVTRLPDDPTKKPPTWPPGGGSTKPAAPKRQTARATAVTVWWPAFKIENNRV